MKKTESRNERAHIYSGAVGKCREPLLSFCRDLYDDQNWKYEDLSPIELLERANVPLHTIPGDELDRVAWFWSRRPRLLSLLAWISWSIAIIGAWCWVTIPGLGLPVVTGSIALVLVSIVRSVRWRRAYESSIDRLIRTPRT
jgi:hypothetical protein